MRCMLSAQAGVVESAGGVRALDGFEDLSKSNQKLVVERFASLRAQLATEQADLEQQLEQLRPQREADEARRRRDLIASQLPQSTAASLANDDAASVNAYHHHHHHNNNNNNDDSMQLDNNNNNTCGIVKLSAPPLSTKTTPDAADAATAAAAPTATKKSKAFAVTTVSKENSSFISNVEHILLRNQGNALPRPAKSAFAYYKAKVHKDVNDKTRFTTPIHGSAVLQPPIQYDDVVLMRRWERLSAAEQAKGLECVGEATELDKAEQFVKAVVKYDESLLLFAKATKEEQNPNTVNLIKTKMAEYKQRSDELKKILESSTKSKKGAAAPAASSASSSSSSSPSTKASANDNNSDVSDDRYLGIGSKTDLPDEFAHPPAIDWSALQEREGKSTSTTQKVSIPSAPAAPKRNAALDKGIVLLEQATALDEQKKFPEALQIYEAGLEQFLEAYKNAAGNPAMQTAIKSKMTTYMTRAEQLKKWLNSKKTEVNESAAPYLSKAIDTVQRAIDADNAGQMNVAMPLYEKAVEYFRSALKLETNANARKMITEKMITYTQRVETLRQTQRNGGSVVANPIKFGLQPGEKYKDPLKKHFWQ